MNTQLHLGDCITVPYPDNHFDLVLCSPPYEAARTYGIDFKLKGQEFVDWCAARYMEHLRVCKGLVAWVIEGQTRDFRYSAAPLLLMADLHRRGVNLRKPPIYHRVGIPGSGGPDWLRNDYEFVVCATKGGKLPWSDNTACGHPPLYGPGGAMSHRTRGGSRVNQWGNKSGPGGMGNKSPSGKSESVDRPSHRFVQTIPREGMHNQDTPYSPPVLANPGNVIKGNVGGGAMGSDLAHENEAPFPLWLAEFFVKSFCPPGGIVLDPFCGSGTTLAAAVKNGRNAIGMDIRQSQIDLTAQRVAEAMTATAAPNP